MNVLIADDHDPSRKLLRVTLTSEGHEVTEASDGQEALDRLDDFAFDAVISDILMPRMDGYRFCFEARRRAKFQALPIIIYSATYTSPAEESLALSMGADRFLRKPSPAAVILRTLSEVTSQPRNASASRVPADDLQVLKQYSERLVQTLEEKNLELQGAQEKLSAAYDKLERSERRFRELVDLAPIGIFQTAPDGLFIASNTAFARMLGYSSPQELMGLELARDVYVDVSDRLKVLREMSRRESVSGLELRLRKRDGTPIWVQTDGRTVRDPMGKVLRYEVFALDVTERKQAEGALRESEQRFRQVTESIDEVFWLTDVARNNVMYVSPAYERIWGRTCESVYASPRNWMTAIHPEDRSRLNDAAVTMQVSGAYDVEYRILRPDGSVRWIHDRAFPIRNAEQEVYRIAGVAEDVTDRRQAEEALRTSEARKRAVLEASLDAIITIDEEGRVIEVNPATERTFGWAASEMMGRDLAEMVIPPAFREAYRKGLERHRVSGDARILGKVIEMPAMRRGGEEFPVELFISRVEVEGAPHFVGYIRDLTERKKAERDTRRSEERFRRLFDSNAIGITVADLTGAILEANDAFLTMLGYTGEDLRSGRLRWDDMTPPEYRALDQAAVESLRGTGVASPWEKEMFRKDGTRVPVLLGVAMLEASAEASCIAYVVDLSKSRQLEKQLRQAQKMEAVGQLAGGVAHDFNNLLTAILGYAELAATRMSGDLGGLEEIEEIRKAGERAAALTRQLLAFSRQQVLAPRVLDLNVIVGDLEKMLRRLLGENVDFVTTLNPSLGCVRADPGEIEQVIMNLAVNARDAMPEGGRISIETANVELDEAYAREHGTVVRPGRYAMLAVSDTGLGMDAETQSHIFEPFFTTKAKDKGTGLGLSTVYGIVKQSGGWIWVYSEPGRGTTMKIYLPEVDGSAEAVPLRVETPLTGGSETVLLTEDEAPVRKLARKVLEGLGYTVLEAPRGEDALSIAQAHPGPIHLVLTDVVMPEMGGADLASRVQELRPDTRVLFMSGYTDDTVVRHRVLESGTHFLQKPFTPASLARKVREALA